MLRRLVQRTRRDLLRPTIARLDTIDLRLNHLEVWLTGELESIRTEFESRSRDQRLHTEAAVRACQIATVDIAHQHAERAADNAQREAIRAAQVHAESAAANAAELVREAATVHANVSISAATDLLRVEIDALRQQTDGLRREIASVRSALARRPSGDRAQGHSDSAAFTATKSSTGTAPNSAIDDLLYLALENRFRGDPIVIEVRQERYVDFVKDVASDDHPVLDLGCGRGEWLRVLRRNEIPARGVDSNEACIDECVTDGLNAEAGDLLLTLRSADTESFGAVTMFQVVEHLPFEVLADVIRECYRVLVPGGVLICETPNALNLKVAAVTFWIDPTHQRPLHPGLLRFVASEAGFCDMEDVFANDLGDVPIFARIDGESDKWLQRFAQSIEGPADYALVARVPA